VTNPIRLGALISGGGRTVMNLLDEIEAGRLDASIDVVIASKPGIAGVERARDRGLEVAIIDKAVYPDDAARHDAITQTLLAAGVELVCLCGYLAWFRIDADLRGRVINIHPALLPRFGGKGLYGDHVHAAVLAAGESYSGCTVHLVDDIYDHGPTIVQRACPVLPDDDVRSLANRVFDEECRALPAAIQLFAEQRVRLEGNRVVVLPGPVGAA
jgi:formyltetrahydrofolate-dependent phosphoribosylglycinamide formyltransferase